MITRKERIELFIQDVWEDYRYKGYEAFKDVALKLINWADEHPKNPWVSVNERLPEKLNKFFSDFVLVMYTRGGKPYPFITRYDYDCGIWEIENVTHWMPIPELKGGEE